MIVTTAWKCVVWYPNIKPEDRNATTLSDGAVFRYASDAKLFCEFVESRGGKLSSVEQIQFPAIWYESVQEFMNLGKMSLAQIEAIKLRCADNAAQFNGKRNNNA